MHAMAKLMPCHNLRLRRGPGFPSHLDNRLGFCPDLRHQEGVHWEGGQTSAGLFAPQIHAELGHAEWEHSEWG